jgi:hypothetical protein
MDEKETITKNQVAAIIVFTLLFVSLLFLMGPFPPTPIQVSHPPSSLSPQLTVSLSLVQTPYGWLGQYPSSVVSHVSGGIPPYSYQWYVGTNPVPGAQSSVFSIPASMYDSASAYAISVLVTDSAGVSVLKTIMVNYDSIDISMMGYAYILMMVLVALGVADGFVIYSMARKSPQQKKMA